MAKTLEQIILEGAVDPDNGDNIFKLVFVIKGSEVYTKHAQRHTVNMALREGMPLEWLPEALESLAAEIRKTHKIKAPEPETKLELITSN